MFINTFFVAFFVFLYFIYVLISDNQFLYKLANKTQKLTILQLVFFIFIAFVTLCSTYIFIHLDKFYNTPFINGLLSRGMSAILLMAVGVFMFKEEYSYQQISGVFLTIFGLYLVIPTEID
jgi:drug/metabolite transporter (DMT)-like permease